jgi:hypothetical protein
VTSQADVIGNTGIACGNFKVSRKHKEYPWVSAKKRWSSTWVKTNGQWKLVFYHFELVLTQNLLFSLFPFTFFNAQMVLGFNIADISN